jgi:hypothetical protein
MIYEARDAKLKSAAIGIRMHSGWGAVVAVSDGGMPEVIDRRRVIVADPGVPGSKQPYHHAKNLGLQKAEEHLDRCSAASGELASAALGEMLSQIGQRGYRVEGCAILLASGRALPSLGKILASHALIHTAEGAFFRTVLHESAQQAGITVTGLAERELEERASEVFGKKAPEVKERIFNAGRFLGPPWTQDQKLAALAALLILNQHSGSRMTG